MAKAAKADWRKASKSFQLALTSASEQVSDNAILILAMNAGDFLYDVGGTAGDKGTVPYYTGNLLDSIGVRILKGNTLMQYRTMTEMTTKHATKPQSMGGVRNIWGDEELMRRINRPSRRQGKGVVAQLMVGVPYAESVDQTHDYFGELKDRFVNGVSRDLERLRQRKYIVG